MKKLFILATCFLSVACVEYNEKQKMFYEVSEEPQVVLSPSYTYPTTQHTQSSDGSVVPATYMAEQTDRLQEIFSGKSVTIKQAKSSIIIVLPHELAFGSNQTTLDPQFEPALSAMAKLLKEYDKTKIKIVGYTDNVGSVGSNKALSLRRANAVSNFLRLNGVDINRIVVDGLGQENPLANNKTAQGREKNHRIEITLTNIQ